MNNKSKRTNQKGFTLIELMIVVAIIGVLSAIAVPAYKDYVSKSEASSALATLKSLQTPAELTFQEEGSLSSAISALGVSSGSNTLGTLSISNVGSSTVSPAILFTFNGGSLNSATLTLSRDATTGWACAKSTTVPDLDGCR
ncbi:pilin [Vibrio splendidus]|uniref:pilin n=1 Tax=Vibrio TaxID=662 RepID=UPI000C820679|nr:MULTISPECIES: pilin [Vibrio]MBO7912593.1 pilin [Vibrio sp. G41H]MCF7490668.1 pilin [Vibrio sp. G-C-1]PMO39314.1 pilus assembly protein PilA [Vibrio splendidus]